MSIRPMFGSALIALGSFVLMPVAQAQATVPASPAPAASAGPVGKPPQRLLTPAEKRANADNTITGETRPEGAVKPQLSIPIGRTPNPPTVGELRAVKPAASATGVDESAAACDAEIGTQARTACRAKRRSQDAAAAAKPL